MKKCIEGSQAVAEIIKLIKPDVIASYPITPQTHIVEDLSKMKADGEADFEFVLADGEFAAMSIVEGAAAAGSRTYTASSSQGLLLMTEVIFNVAGMRLPIVMTCANRTLGAPLSIWNDQQDAITMRDAGWLMFFAEDNQAAMDLHLLAYKIAEQLKVPAMVNMDGFVLTHTFESVDMPSQNQVDKFLPKYKPTPGQFLDVNNPVSLGCFATPADYQEIRLELAQDMNLAIDLFKKESIKFKQIFNREYKLVDYYGSKNADFVFVSMGSVIGTIKDAVDQLNKENNKVGVVNVNCFRPFPDDEIIKKLSSAKNIAIIEKDISLGSEGALSIDIKRSLYNKNQARVQSIVTGLGGRDITIEMIKKIYSKKDKFGDGVMVV